MSSCLVTLHLTEHKASYKNIDLDCLTSMHKLQHLDIVAWWESTACWKSQGQLSLLTSLKSFCVEQSNLQGPLLAALSTFSSLTTLLIPNSSQGLSNLDNMTFGAVEKFCVTERDDLLRPVSLCVHEIFRSLCSLSLFCCNVTSQPAPLHLQPSLTYIYFSQCEFEAANWLLDTLEGATQVLELSLTHLELEPIAKCVQHGWFAGVGIRAGWHF